MSGSGSSFSRPSGLRQTRGLVIVQGTGRPFNTATRAALGTVRVVGGGTAAWTGDKRTTGVVRMPASGLSVIFSLNPAKIIPAVLLLTVSRTGPESSSGAQQAMPLVPLIESGQMSLTSDDETFPPRVIEQDGQVLLIYYEPTVVLSAEG